MPMATSAGCNFGCLSSLVADGTGGGEVSSRSHPSTVRTQGAVETTGGGPGSLSPDHSRAYSPTTTSSRQMATTDFTGGNSRRVLEQKRVLCDQAIVAPHCRVTGGSPRIVLQHNELRTPSEIAAGSDVVLWHRSRRGRVALWQRLAAWLAAFAGHLPQIHWLLQAADCVGSKFRI